MTAKQKKWLKISGIIVVVLLLIGFTFNQIVSSIIESKVRDYLAEHKPVKGYELSFDRIGFNFMNRSIHMVGIKLVPDSALIDTLVKSGYKSKFFEVGINRISLIGVELKKMINNQEISLRKIRIKKPDVKIYMIKGKKQPEKIKEKRNKKIFEALEDSVKIKGINGVNIGLIELERSNFDIIDYKTQKTVISNDDIYFLLKNISLSKSPYDDDYLYPSIENASLTIENNKIKLPGNLYEIGFKKFYFNLNERFIQIDKLRYKPLYTKKVFSKKIKWQQERFDVEVKQVKLNNVDLEQLIVSNILHIRRIDIVSADIRLYRDKNVPFDHSRRPLLPHQALKRMTFPMKVDSIVLSKSYFEYEELMEKAKRKDPIHINFTKISGVITGVNTIKKELNKKSVLKVDVLAYLMNKAPVRLKLEFPLTAKNDVFYFSAEINRPFDLRILNKAVYPAAGMKFKKGIVDLIQLQGIGYPTYAQGRFKMLYHDLEMAALDKSGVKSIKTLTWGVNQFVASDNPKKGKKPRETVMFYERDMEKGFGNFFWKTIYSGMKGTIIPLFEKQSARRFEKFIKERQESKKPASNSKSKKILNLSKKKKKK